VPDGLYFYNHDNHIVDTNSVKNDDVKISNVIIRKKKIGAKNNFMLPSSDGKWEYSQVASDFVWKCSIPHDDWIKEIAINSRKIAEEVQRSISVMWFVGVNAEAYECNVFPWHHEEFEYDANDFGNKKHTRGETRIIAIKDDVDRLQQIALNESGGNRIKCLRIKPQESGLIRNKEFVSEVGQLALNLDAVIVLEGSVLSHAYYQLKRTGAKIETTNMISETVATVVHNKLVRDKIPSKIKNSGELLDEVELASHKRYRRLKEKLLEEAFEVLDAENIEDLTSEIADVLEVLDSIMKEMKIDRKLVDDIKVKKKEKVGGFDLGIVLRSTSIPVYNANALHKQQNHDVQPVAIVKSDKREYFDRRELFKSIKVPIHLEHWGTRINDFSTKPYKYVTLKGKRVNSELVLQVSIVTEEFEQMTLDDLHVTEQ
jgi:predicted house-cleaning noncanonical NTP pyrophosphatase (MazG superfamily)